MADSSTTLGRHGHDGSPASTAGTVASVHVLSVRECPQVTVIRLRGDIDLLVLPALDVGLHVALQRRTHLLVDLGDVHLIDCACLNLLMRARHTAQQNNTVLALMAQPPLVRLTLHATGLAAAFPTFTGRQQALATLAADLGKPLPGTRWSIRRQRRRSRCTSLSANGTRP